MKTREKGYENHYRFFGFDSDEAKKLKAFCRRPDFAEHKLLLDSAISANPTIASDLYYSLVNGISYDSLSKIKYIPLPQVDFYGYQRKCLFIFRNQLLINNKGKYIAKDDPVNLFDTDNV